MTILRFFSLFPIIIRYRLIAIASEIYFQKANITPDRGEKISLALQKAGPIFVKFGQMLSTRRDLLPSDIIDALTKLQDRVPPFDGKIAKQLIEKSLGQSTEVLFAAFDETPLGSASIAQVHAATLHNKEAVVVKILRPQIDKQIKQDIQLLFLITRLLEFFSNTLKRLRIHGVVEEFKLVTAKEIDLNYEAANASLLKRNMEKLDWVVIPTVHWPYVRKNVAVFDRIHAINMGDKDALIAAGFDLPLLSQKIITLFFTAVFEHNFFHADMHPGNIFIQKEGHDFQIVLVDFGIMGTLPASDQLYLAKNFSAFFSRDYAQVAALHIESGWVPKNTRASDFADAIRTVCEPIFSRTANDVSFAELFLRLLETARSFDMVILPQLILLQKTLMNVEGLARYLDEEVDIWAVAKPCIEKWYQKKRMQQLPQVALRMLDNMLHQQNQVLSNTETIREMDNQYRKQKNKYFCWGAGCSATLMILGWLVI